MATARPRRYTVTLSHACRHSAPTRREVSANNLSTLLQMLHGDNRPDYKCTECGVSDMTVDSVNVIQEEDELAQRLGIFADELLAATA